MSNHETSAGHTPVALTIAGSDSSGGAGIQADLKAFAANGVYGTSAITAITAQNTLGVVAIEALEPELVVQQIQAVLDDFPVAAVKLGMLHGEAIINAVADILQPLDIPVVLDPVMVATSGDRLLAREAEVALKKRLLPLAALVTPNLHEAAVLLSAEIATSVDEMEQQARRLRMSGARAVLLKGGHLAGRQSADVLVSDDEVKRFDYEKVATENTHGTGCTLAAAIAANLARGCDLPKAVAEARHYLHSTIIYADKLGLGHGPGPVNHFYKYW